MKEVTIKIKIDDNFDYGNCHNCRFSKDMKYSDHFNRWLYKCGLYSSNEFIMNKESCPIQLS